MAQYWLMGIYIYESPFDTAFTSSAALNLDEAIQQLHIWENHYGYKFAKTWIQVIEDNTIRNLLVNIDKKLVKDLWENFGDVPMNPETECIEDFWGKFMPGDHREDIWHWFEDTFNVRVFDLMEGTI